MAFLGVRESSTSQRPWECRESQVLCTHGHCRPCCTQQHCTPTELLSGALWIGVWSIITVHKLCRQSSRGFCSLPSAVLKAFSVLHFQAMPCELLWDAQKWLKSFSLIGTNWSCLLSKKWRKNLRVVLKDCKVSGCQCQRNVNNNFFDKVTKVLLLWKCHNTCVAITSKLCNSKRLFSAEIGFHLFSLFSLFVT